MTLQELLNTIVGNYELTILLRHHTDYVCHGEEIPGGSIVDFRKYVPEWDAVKNRRVLTISLYENRNHDGPAIWIIIDREGISQKRIDARLNR